MGNSIAAQFLNGNAFLAGMVLAIMAGALGLRKNPQGAGRATRLRRAVCAILVAFSGTALPFWMYAIWGILAITVWWASGAKVFVLSSIQFRVLLALFIFQSVFMFVREIPYHLAPIIPVPSNKTLFVVGDSLSMGADPPGKNWPEALGDKAGLTVRNFSFGGAKVGTALSNAKRIDLAECLVLLEIGGNDLLGGTPVKRFESDLEQMLSIVCTTGRKVVMFELPLPPLFNRYGMVQRKLAAAHGVTLIPKRVLVDVLRRPGMTIDGLHLSNEGHEMLADAVAALLR